MAPKKTDKKKSPAQKAAEKKIKESKETPAQTKKREAKEAEKATEAAKAKEAEELKKEKETLKLDEAEKLGEGADAVIIPPIDPVPDPAINLFPVVAKGIINNSSAKCVQRPLTLTKVNSGALTLEHYPVYHYRLALDTTVPNGIKILKTVSLPHGGGILNRIAVEQSEDVVSIGNLEVILSKEPDLTNI